jgi:sn-glycerol 3-phosphate transport system ATP-binding protein
VVRPGRVAIGSAEIEATDMAADLAAGSAIEIGLRPEDLEPRADGPLTMSLDFIEELGATQLFHGALDGVTLVVQAPTGTVEPVDGRLKLGIDPGRVHLFDPASGERRGR